MTALIQASITSGLSFSSDTSGNVAIQADGGVIDTSATTGSGGYYAGGSGIAIVYYLGAQRGTGGAVTSSGGYTYHTFTSSGSFVA